MLGAGSLARTRMAGFVRAGSSGPDFLRATSPSSVSVSNDLFYLEGKKNGLCPHLQEVLKLTWDWHFRGGTLTMTKANLREVICPSVGKYLQRE